LPALEIQLNEASLGRTAFEVARQLKRGSPAVYVNERRLHEGVLLLFGISLNEGSTAVLIERLRRR
jgi:hypothetical protein